MAGRLSDQDTQAVLNNRFGGVTATATGTHYIGLSTTTPASDGSGVTEPSGNGYARIAVTNNTTNWPSISGTTRVKTNGTAFTFPTATPSGWGAITHFVVFDHLTNATAANVRAYGPITGGPVTVAAGETRAFPVGSLTITAPNS